MSGSASGGTACYGLASDGVASGDPVSGDPVESGSILRGSASIEAGREAKNERLAIVAPYRRPGVEPRAAERDR